LIVGKRKKSLERDTSSYSAGRRSRRSLGRVLTPVRGETARNSPKGSTAAVVAQERGEKSLGGGGPLQLHAVTPEKISWETKKSEKKKKKRTRLRHNAGKRVGQKFKKKRREPRNGNTR